MSEQKLQQYLAICESGTIDKELYMNIEQNDDGENYFIGEDELHNYFGEVQRNIKSNGTIFIRNKKTNEIKAIPVENYLMLRKKLKIGSDSSIGKVSTRDLIEHFGTQRSQRIMKSRMNT